MKLIEATIAGNTDNEEKIFNHAEDLACELITLMTDPATLYISSIGEFSSIPPTTPYSTLQIDLKEKAILDITYEIYEIIISHRQKKE